MGFERKFPYSVHRFEPGDSVATAYGSAGVLTLSFPRDAGDRAPGEVDDEVQFTEREAKALRKALKAWLRYEKESRDE